MSNKHLFAPAGKSPRPDTHNEAGGSAYSFSPEHALAQYAITGTFHGTFYATDKEQLDRVAALASAVSPELVAKTAIYCRENGRMKDMPAFLVAHLAARDVGTMLRVFPRVIDDGRMLRNFVQIVRSGVTGRKSFGSAPKRALRTWFASRSPDVIFRQSIGQSPSMSDVIKMVRPPPRNDKGEADAVREALYGYLIGKNVDADKLPVLTRAFEAWKRGTGTAPRRALRDAHRAAPQRGELEGARQGMTTTQLRMNLNTLLRHGVFDDPAMVADVAARLSDAEAIRRARDDAVPAPRCVPPRRQHASGNRPRDRAGLEHSVTNVPELGGRVVSVLTSRARCSHPSPAVAARRDQGALHRRRCALHRGLCCATPVRPCFPSRTTSSRWRPLNPLDSIVTNAEVSRRSPAAGRHARLRSAGSTLEARLPMSWCSSPTTSRGQTSASRLGLTRTARAAP